MRGAPSNQFSYSVTIAHLLLPAVYHPVRDRPTPNGEKTNRQPFASGYSCLFCCWSARRPPRAAQVLEVLAKFAECFQGREEWEACARWCRRAIALARGGGELRTAAAAAAVSSTAPLSPAGSAGAANPAGPAEGGGKGPEEKAAAALLLSSLLTLRGNVSGRKAMIVSVFSGDCPPPRSKMGLPKSRLAQGSATPPPARIHLDPR